MTGGGTGNCEGACMARDRMMKATNSTVVGARWVKGQPGRPKQCRVVPAPGETKSNIKGHLEKKHRN